jgi:hypothetical protein
VAQGEGPEFKSQYCKKKKKVKEKKRQPPYERRYFQIMPDKG